VSRFYLRTETESSLRNVVVFKKWTRRWIMSKNIILVIIYHRHRHLDLIPISTMRHSNLLHDFVVILFLLLL
jgi:hypothetical protein